MAGSQRVAPRNGKRLVPAVALLTVATLAAAQEPQIAADELVRHSLPWKKAEASRRRENRSRHVGGQNAAASFHWEGVTRWESDNRLGDEDERFPAHA